MDHEVTIFKNKKQTPSSAQQPSGTKGGLAAPSSIHNVPQNPTPTKQIAVPLEAQKEIKKIDDLIQEEEVIYQAATVFPFTLFPDKIIIKSHKITIIHKVFWKSETVHSVAVKDVAWVEAATSIFFGTLEVTDKYFSEAPFRLRFLKKAEALKARRIIQGLMVSTQNNIDIAKIEKSLLIPKLEQLGESGV